MVALLLVLFVTAVQTWLMCIVVCLYVYQSYVHNCLTSQNVSLLFVTCVTRVTLFGHFFFTLIAVLQMF